MVISYFQDILISYRQAETNRKELDTMSWIPFVVFTVGMLLYIIELGCYLKLFHYLYIHNERIGILTPDIKSKRNKTNAQTMIGQFYFFVSDSLYMVFAFVALLHGITPVSAELKDLVIFLKTLDFGLVSFIHCLLIPDIRRKFYHCWLKFFEKLKSVIFYCPLIKQIKQKIM
jgi:hypothetical protein